MTTSLRPAVSDPAERVLVASHEASRTGAPRVAVDLIRSLRQAGYEVIVGHRWGGPLEGELDEAAAASLRQPAARLRVALQRVGWRTAAGWIDRRTAAAVIRRARPDVVWCNTIVAASYATAARRRGIPTVVYSHEQADWLRSRADVLRSLNDLTLVACSPDTARQLASTMAIDEASITVLRPAVDVERLSQVPPVRPAGPGGQAVVVACGTADHRKGFDVFVAAASLARARGLDHRFRWVGAAGPDARANAGGVELVGEVADPVALLAGADVVTVTSRSEGFPVVVLEAMAVGRPIVASDLPGIREQLGESGVLIAPDDPEALIDAIEGLLADPERRDRLGAAARARCQERWDIGAFARTAAAITAAAVGGAPLDSVGQMSATDRPKSAVFDWTTTSNDPNAMSVIRQRQAVLDAARRPPVAHRNPYLQQLATGRDVLDVGVVEHMAENEASDRWLHRQLVEVSGSCIGVDILADDVATLVAKGYDIRVHDLVEAPLPGSFDLIVAGELIEHLDQPGPFLRHAREMLRPEGRLVLTTPNPYMLHRTWKHLRGGHPDSADHCLLLGPGQILELASRAGLVLDSWRGIALKDLPGWRNRASSLMRKALSSSVFTDEIRCDSLIYELVLPAAP